MTDPTPTPTRAEVERFSPVDIHERNADMLAEPDGQWVRLCDYQALRDRAEAAERAEVAAWNDAIEAAASVYLNGANPNTWDYFSLARHEIRALRRAAPAPSDALAWIHEVHYEEGCGSNKKLTFDANHPFGVAGVDYSPEYKITSTPLHAVASSDQIKPIAEFGRGTLVVDTGHHYGTPSVFVGPSQARC